MSKKSIVNNQSNSNTQSQMNTTSNVINQNNSIEKIIAIVNAINGKRSFTEENIKDLKGLYFVDAYEAFIEEFSNKEDDIIFEIDFPETIDVFDELLDDFRTDNFHYKKIQLYRKFIAPTIFTDELEDEIISEYEYSLIPECECCGKQTCLNENYDESDTDDDFDFERRISSSNKNYKRFF